MIQDGRGVDDMNEKTPEKTVVTKSLATTRLDGGSRVIVVDIGKKQKKRAIRRLRQGRGSLMPKIESTIKDIQKEAGVADALPIVIVVRQRRARRGLF
jgi:hypothetical protein